MSLKVDTSRWEVADMEFYHSCEVLRKLAKSREVKLHEVFIKQAALRLALSFTGQCEPYLYRSLG